MRRSRRLAAKRGASDLEPPNESSSSLAAAAATSASGEAPPAEPKTRQSRRKKKKTIPDAVDADGDVAMAATEEAVPVATVVKSKSKKRKATTSKSAKKQSKHEEEDEETTTERRQSKRSRKVVSYAELEAVEEDDEEEEEEEEDGAMCLCGGGDDGRAMIGCDACDRWLHLECVGLAEDSPELEADEYSCPACESAKKAKRMKKKRKATSSSSTRKSSSASSSSSSKRSKSAPAAETKAERVKAVRAQLKKTAAKDVRRELELRGEVVARSGKKAEMVESLIKLYYGMEQPEVMATVMGSEHLLNLILRFVAPEDLFQCAFVNKLWRRTAPRPELWIPHLPKWQSLVEFPSGVGLGQAAKASVVAAAYLNLYEPGRMRCWPNNCTCKVVPTTDWKKVDIFHEESGTMFQLKQCNTCLASEMMPADAFSRYHIRFKDTSIKARQTTTWWRHYPTHKYFFKVHQMHRFAAAVYGGVTNTRKYERWRDVGGRIGDKPAFAFEEQFDAAHHRWRWTKPPVVVPLPASLLHTAGKPIVKQALKKLRDAGVEEARDPRVVELGEEGRLLCLHERCEVEMLLSDVTHWHKQTLLCERGRCCPEHCGEGADSMCAWHDLEACAPEMKQRRLKVPTPVQWLEGGVRELQWPLLRSADFVCCTTCWNKRLKMTPTVLGTSDCADHFLQRRYGANLPHSLSEAQKVALLVDEVLCVSCISRNESVVVDAGCPCQRCEACCLSRKTNAVMQVRPYSPVRFLVGGKCLHWAPLLPVVVADVKKSYTHMNKLAALTGQQLRELGENQARVEAGELCKPCFQETLRGVALADGRSVCASHYVKQLYGNPHLSVNSLSAEQRALAATSDVAPCFKCLRRSSVLVTQGVCKHGLCEDCCLGDACTSLVRDRVSAYCTHWSPLQQTWRGIGASAPPRGFTGREVQQWLAEVPRVQDGSLCKTCFVGGKVVESPGNIGLCRDHAIETWYAGYIRVDLKTKEKRLAFDSGAKCCVDCLRKGVVTHEDLCGRHVCAKCCSYKGMQTRNSQRHCTHGKRAATELQARLREIHPMLALKHFELRPTRAVQKQLEGVKVDRICIQCATTQGGQGQLVPALGATACDGDPTGVGLCEAHLPQEIQSAAPEVRDAFVAAGCAVCPNCLVEGSVEKVAEAGQVCTTCKPVNWQSLIAKKGCSQSANGSMTPYLREMVTRIIALLSTKLEHAVLRRVADDLSALNYEVCLVCLANGVVRPVGTRPSYGTCVCASHVEFVADCYKRHREGNDSSCPFFQDDCSKCQHL